MTKLSDLFDLALFEEMKGKGFVRVQRHPEFPNELAIANYTNRTQINYLWNEVTTQCRGLIYHPETLEIIARPFKKFFNHDESKADKFMPDDEVEVFDKLDGSLGISYERPDGMWAIATRGSFTSDQAIWATQYLSNRIQDYPFGAGYTDLFEIIYPENRIVVSYDFQGLVYLGTINVNTGEFGFEGEFFYPTADRMYRGKLRDFEFLERENREGVVLVAKDGRRAKMKYDEYVRLHRVVSRLSARSVWELMQGPDGDIESLVSQLPEEHATWAREVAQALRGQYFTMHMYITELAMKHDVKKRERKEVALALEGEPAWARAAIFRGLDNKSYTDVLWKNLRPREDVEGGVDEGEKESS